MKPIFDAPSAKVKKRYLALKGILVGLVVGVVAVGFRLCLEQAERMRGEMFAFCQSHPFSHGLIPPVLFGFGIWLALSILYRFSPEASGSGIPHLKGFLKGLLPFRGWRVLIVKFLGGVLGIGSGLALGREGPTIQMGGALGQISGHFLCSLRDERRFLILAGAGAGLAGAFNAPLAGIFFVLEELESGFNKVSLVTSFAACISADIVCRLITGQLPVFHMKIAYYPEMRLIPLFVLLGIFVGTVGLIFSKSLLSVLDLFRCCGRSKKIFLGVILGVGFGILGLLQPDLLGSGANLLNQVFNREFAGKSLLMFFGARLILTILSYSTGAPGGIFAPLLVLGAISGLIFRRVILMIAPDIPLQIAVWGVLGMAGCFSAIVRAPLTGIVLIVEMTNQHYLLLPLIIVSIVSYSIPEYFDVGPIYEVLMLKDLQKREDQLPNQQIG